jgi:two-component system chemotaxis response regulator CheY
MEIRSFNLDHNTKVLLVEDDPVTRWLVRQALKNECHLATASTAYRALTLYMSWQPDLVFLDINLPDHNGLELLEWIIHRDPHASVVMFSSLNTADLIAKALKNGAQGFITKPFLKENLLDYVRDCRSTA